MKVAAVLFEGFETLENNLAFVRGGPFAHQFKAVRDTRKRQPAQHFSSSAPTLSPRCAMRNGLYAQAHHAAGKQCLDCDTRAFLH